MRTDSLRISDEAQAQARELIHARYGAAYYPDTPRKYKTKAGAQDAHEAIRPSDPSLTPEQVKGDLTSEQYRLYRLIWSRFLASQMANAVYDSISVEIAAGSHYPATRPVYRRYAYPNYGGKRHRPSLHLCAHRIHHPGP